MGGARSHGQSDSLPSTLFHVVPAPNPYKYFLSPKMAKQAELLPGKPAGQVCGARVEGGVADQL